MIKLIASAAYVNQELAAEFGLLPPAFLPIGVSRLYEAQIAALGSEGPLYMTVPADFAPSSDDLIRLGELGVTLVAVPSDMSLADSLLFALGSIGALDAPLFLLHGDTLIQDIAPLMDGDNRIAVQQEGDDYSWAAVTVSDGRVVALEDVRAGAERDQPCIVACGAFSFVNSTLLVGALARARGSFINGLSIYARENVVHATTVKSWRDFGHLQTYFRSRQVITTTRAFNALTTDADVARKVSADRDKMLAEAGWLTGVPPLVAPYVARVLGQHSSPVDAQYLTEYLYAPTLSELYVFGRLGRPTWRRILGSCERFLNYCASAAAIGTADTDTTVLNRLVGDKTFERLRAYADAGGLDVDGPMVYDGQPLPSLMRIAETMAGIVGRAAPLTVAIMHGDLCFSNILYNSRTGRITVIDPRGYVEPGAFTIFGSTRYDLSKLRHSVVGLYDHILAGHYTLSVDGSSLAISFAQDDLRDWLAEALADLMVGPLRADDEVVQAVTVSLFLSMLPLHSDRPDRQQAFVANALRLFIDLEKRAV